MCFSPQADIAGGLVITAIGVDAVRHIRQRREFIALAWLPLLLGAHQFIEAFVWLWLQGHVPRAAGQAWDPVDMLGQPSVLSQYAQS